LQLVDSIFDLGTVAVSLHTAGGQDFFFALRRFEEGYCAAGKRGESPGLPVTASDSELRVVMRKRTTLAHLAAPRYP
jgi:hypothetical protein